MGSEGLTPPTPMDQIHADNSHSRRKTIPTKDAGGEYENEIQNKSTTQITSRAESAKKLNDFSKKTNKEQARKIPTRNGRQQQQNSAQKRRTKPRMARRN